MENNPVTGSAAKVIFANSRRVWSEAIGDGDLPAPLRAETEDRCWPRFISDMIRPSCQGGKRILQRNASEGAEPQSPVKLRTQFALPVKPFEIASAPQSKP